MNEKLMPIFSRRSVRRYHDTPIAKETVISLLEAGMAAPSACGKDPWEFIVVREPDSLSQIGEALPNGGFLSDAPLGIAVCGDSKRAHGEELSYLLQDCSAAIENILLAASMLELGACWLGIHPRSERIAFLRRHFGLPDRIIPVGMIAVGWPAEAPPPRTRCESAYIHWNKWE